MTIVWGLDVGTQSTKGLALDVDAGRIVARASHGYGLIEGLAAGAAEQHPDTWREALRHVCQSLARELGEELSRTRAVGVSGQQHGLVVLDDRDQVVRPAKLWCDTETAPEALELSETLGRSVPAGFTASKVLWLIRHEAESWRRTRSVLLPHDYVNFLLTGRKCMEAGDASGTGFFDPVRRAFDERAIEAIDPRLAECLPDLVGPTEPAGVVQGCAAGEFGIPGSTWVSAGGGDNMMSAIGSGATRPGLVTISLGTSGTVFAETDHPVLDPEGLIAPFCSSTGAWLPLLCVMNLTGVTEEVRAAFQSTHADLTRAAAEVPIGCDGLTWLPFLAGERVPDLPRATGTLQGMRAGHLRPGVLYRAALEGTSLNLGAGVARLKKLGVSGDRFHLVGGAARNPLWRRILADVLDAPVLPLRETESAALGAALQALWSWRCQENARLTIHEVAEPWIEPAEDATLPDADRVARYAELSRRFQQSVRDRYGS